MERLQEDKKLIDLLSQLKNTGGEYPSDIFAARRENYLKQVANIGLGIGIGVGLKNTAKSGNSIGTAATVTSKILETALVAAIAIEVGAVAYLYRDKIADIIKTYTGSSNVQEVATQADNNATSVPEVINPLVTNSATISYTPSATISVTSSPEVASATSNNDNRTSPSISSTPDPDGNGNQYGLTPKPVRTKDSGNNQSNSQDNNDVNKIK